MKFRQTFSWICVWAAAAGLAGPLGAQEPNFSGDLILGGTATEQPTESAQTQPDLLVPWSGTSARALSLTPPPSSAFTGDSVVQSMPSTDSGPDGFDAFPVLTLTAVEYRSRPGMGLGVASNYGWLISQSFVLGRNLDLTLFYLNDAEMRAKGLDAQSAELGRILGLRLSWSY